MSQKEKPESGQAGTETDRLLADLATEIRRPVAPANAENAAISGVCKCGAPIDEHEFVPEAASETPSDVRRNGVSGYPVCPKPRNAGNAAPDAGACPLCKGGPLKGHVVGCAALAGEPLDLAGSGESSMTVKSPEDVEFDSAGYPHKVRRSVASGVPESLTAAPGAENAAIRHVFAPHSPKTGCSCGWGAELRLDHRPGELLKAWMAHVAEVGNAGNPAPETGVDRAIATAQLELHGEKCGYRKLFYKRAVLEHLLAVQLGIPADDFTCQWQIDANGVFLGVVVFE